MLPSSEVEKLDGARAPAAGESLALAFASFTEAAGSLEISYGQLQQEVTALRQQLSKANRDLEEERENARRAQALADVATLLAHEIRNPLASLELFASLLADSAELGEDNRKVVSHIQAGLRTLAATVNNVLHFHSSPLPELVPTRLSNLVSMTLDFLRPLARQSNIDFEFVDELGEALIGADPHRLQQVMLNLAMNSIRFMPGGGHFTIIARMVGEQTAELLVEDTGPGVPVEVRERIFEPGFTTRVGSPGLGLAVCRKIVEQHDGSIQLEDRAPGARFVLRFRVL